VSQNQVYKSIKTLTELGLIEETEAKRGNVKSVLHPSHAKRKTGSTASPQDKTDTNIRNVKNKRDILSTPRYQASFTKIRGVFVKYLML
jgi:Fe2+ or Zn2+ uptake regulation protein